MTLFFLVADRSAQGSAEPLFEEGEGRPGPPQGRPGQVPELLHRAQHHDARQEPDFDHHSS